MSGASPLTLEKTNGAALTNYKIYGNSIQENVNLFDGTFKNGYINNPKVLGFSENLGTQHLIVMPCKPNTKYTIKKEYATQRFSMGFSDEYPYTDCTLTNVVVKNTSSELTSTSTENSQYLVAFVYNKSIDTLALPDITIYEDISTDNPIEVKSVGEYDETSGKYKIPVTVKNGDILNEYEIYIDEPLRKIGDYADYIDFQNQKVVRQVGEYKITGTENWKVLSTTYPYNFHVTNAIDTKYEENIKILSNQYIGQDSDSGSKYGDGNTWVQSVDTYPRLYISDESYDSVDTFKQALADKYNSGNPVVIYYPLSTQDDTEPIELPTITTYEGNCIIEINTEVVPSKITVEYEELKESN